MKDCLFCKKPFSKAYRYTRNEFSLRKYCGKSCSNKANAGKGGFKKGHPPNKSSFQKGHQMSEATKIKIGLALKGRPCLNGFQKGHPAWNKGIRVATNTGRTRFKKGAACGEEHWNWKGGNIRKPDCISCGKKLTALKVKTGKCRPCAGKDRTGENHPNWVNGNYKKAERKDKSSAYMYWMLAVKKRDGWKCRIADENCKGRLEAHHILPWRDYVELRYEINNGITLCHAHHPRERAEEKRLSPYFKELISTKEQF